MTSQPCVFDHMLHLSVVSLFRKKKSRDHCIWRLDFFFFFLRKVLVAVICLSDLCRLGFCLSVPTVCLVVLTLHLTAPAGCQTCCDLAFSVDEGCHCCHGHLITYQASLHVGMHVKRYDEVTLSARPKLLKYSRRRHQ